MKNHIVLDFPIVSVPKIRRAATWLSPPLALSRVLSLKPPGATLPLESRLWSFFIQGFRDSSSYWDLVKITAFFFVSGAGLFFFQMCCFHMHLQSAFLFLSGSHRNFCWDLEEGRTLVFSGYTRCVRTGRVLDGCIFLRQKKRPVFKCLCVCTRNTVSPHIDNHTLEETIENKEPFFESIIRAVKYQFRNTDRK